MNCSGDLFFFLYELHVIWPLGSLQLKTNICLWSESLNLPHVFVKFACKVPFGKLDLLFSLPPCSGVVQQAAAFGSNLQGPCIIIMPDDVYSPVGHYP